MWTVRSEKLNDGFGQRFAIDLNGQPATYSNVVAAWQTDVEFRRLFNSLLADTPFTSFRWETPGVSAFTVNRPFEFVVLDSPGLARNSDSQAFAEHFSGCSAGVVTFRNLGGDAQMIVPCPVGSHSAYGHLAAFVRLAPETQRDAL